MLVLRPDLIPTAPALPRRALEGERWYETPEGELVPSVTTVLSATKEPEDCLGLALWRAEIGLEAAEAYTAQRAAEGEAFHAEVEALLCDPFADLAAPPPGSAFLESARPFLGLIEEALAVELRVWHRAGFAGTLDLLAQIRRRGLVLIDWKSTLYPKRREWVRDYELQAAAYVGAARGLFKLDIREALLVLACPGRRADLVWIDFDRLRLLWGGFLARLELFNQKRESGEWP